MPASERPYAGRSSQERRGDRRERFLSAALELLGEGGLATLTVRGVCARAGLTPRYFYAEVATVDELARQLFDREFDLVLARVVGALGAAGGDTDARVAGAVDAALDVLGEAPGRAALLLTEISSSSALAPRRRERMEEVVGLLAALGVSTYGRSDVVAGSEEEAAANEAAAGAVGVAASFVAGGFAQTIDAWLRGEIDLPRANLVRQLTAQIVAVGDAAFGALQQAAQAEADHED
jgi:AcrR family transcriptional regulator